MTTARDVLTFHEPTPAWAAECTYCQPDEWGLYDETAHFRYHVPVTCAVCGETEPDGFLFDNDHGVCLAGSWENDALLCMSIWLRLNHLIYAAQHNQPPDTRDATALALGWIVKDLGGE